MKTSAGIIFTNGNKILACLPTKRELWDIPKGKKEPGETSIEAAIRECKEETGIKVKKKSLESMGTFSYLKDKNLAIFVYYNENLPDISKMKCTSYFEIAGKQVPEIRAYKYVDVDKIDETFFFSLRSILKDVMEKINE